MKDNKPTGLLVPSLGYAILAHVLVGLLTLGLTGCTPGKKKPGTGEENQIISSKDRPPLKVVLVDGAFSRELEIQWQAFSDQPLAIETVSLSDFHARKQDSTDVWIFPANLLGEMVSKQMVSQLPQAAYGKAPSDALDEAAPPKESPMDAWPARWRGASRYGGTVYAMPLGAKPLAVIARGIDLAPLKAAEPTLGRSEELSANSRNAWETVLKAMPSATLPESPEWTPQQLDRLVDHFLFVASTTNARYRGLFDVSKMTAKLDSPDLVNAAQILAEIWRVSPLSILLPPQEAWQRTTDSTDASLAIAYPPNTGDMTSDERDDLQMAGLSWNPNHGLLIAVGKKTRQSAVSNQFVSWLSEPEQRGTFSKLDERIELWPSQPDPNAGRSDYRAYTTLINNVQRPEPTTLLIRFHHAHLYRQRLSEALLACIQSPDQCKSLLAECSKAWDKITEQNNAPQQRLSVEQSTGFSQ